MYNDIPSSSSSSCTSASSSRTASIANTHQSIEQQQPQQLSVFEEEEDDENGGTTIRIRLASAGDLMSRNGRSYDQDGSDYENSFQPCYPLTPLEIDNKPLHRIRRKVSIRKAISDSCRIYSSSGADLQGRSRIREERTEAEKAKVRRRQQAFFKSKSVATEQQIRKASGETSATRLEERIAGGKNAAKR